MELLAPQAGGRGPHDERPLLDEERKRPKRHEGKKKESSDTGEYSAYMHSVPMSIGLMPSREKLRVTSAALPHWIGKSCDPPWRPRRTTEDQVGLSTGGHGPCKWSCGDATRKSCGLQSAPSGLCLPFLVLVRYETALIQTMLYGVACIHLPRGFLFPVLMTPVCGSN